MALVPAPAGGSPSSFLRTEGRRSVIPHEALLGPTGVLLYRIFVWRGRQGNCVTQLVGKGDMR
jgi:hypothetical protein